MATSVDSTWLGENLRPRDRNIKRLVGDVEGRMKSSDCSAEECSQLRARSKQFGAIMNICRFMVAHGQECQGFVQCFDEQCHFLNMDPKVISCHILSDRVDASRVMSCPMCVICHVSCHVMPRIRERGVVRKS